MQQATVMYNNLDNMILDLSKDFDREKFRTYTEYLLKRGCVAEVKERKKQRSLAQNRYLHLILGYFASEFGYDLESVKYDIFKRAVNKDIFERPRTNKRGISVTYVRSSSDLDTGELSTAIERFRNWSAMEAGLYIPSANEDEALLEAEKQVEMYTKYL
jgi:histone deacetylase complex regulatory component SIN3